MRKVKSRDFWAELRSSATSLLQDHFLTEDCGFIAGHGTLQDLSASVEIVVMSANTEARLAKKWKCPSTDMCLGRQT